MKWIKKRSSLNKYNMF